MLYARPGRGQRVMADCSDWQPLTEHLLAVGKISKQLAKGVTNDSSFQANAAAMGLLHDLGKATPEWQRMLRDSAIRGVHRRVPHAVHGAAYARASGWQDIALAIAGHHAGVPNVAGENGLDERCDDNMDAALAAFDILRGECAKTGVDMDSSLANAVAASTHGLTSRLRLDVRIRMLASILADADRTNSATRSDEYTVRGLTGAHEKLGRLLQVAQSRSGSTVVTAVRDARNSVLHRCIEAAGWDDRLVTLNAPTGSGKTLATLAYALARAAVRPADVRRIIVVIPYLSIIEQNARDIANIVGEHNVFEHHSGNLVASADDESPDDRSERRRQLAENWNAPVVITTNVRFFDSLFSNHPSALRRMHSIANSLVIFDEVQTLPRHYLAPMWSMLRGLVDDFGVSCLFSSATLPDLDAAVRPIEKSLQVQGLSPPREILDNRERLHAGLQRVSVRWPARVETIPEVASQLATHTRVLAVVNRKRDALDLFAELGKHVGETGTWHLSTNMCAAHRTDILKAIRHDLKAGRVCRVVSTQLVEAGVDLDFPVVFRAMAPLDSIAQAAGRCDREGKLTDAEGMPAGEVVVFDLGTDHDHPSGTAYRQGGDTTRTHLLLNPQLDIARTEVFDDYYTEWFGKGSLDARGIQAKRRQQDIKDVAEAFRYIDEPTRAVVVPYEAEGGLLVGKLRDGRQPDPNDWKTMHRFAVALYPHQMASLHSAGLIYQANPDLDIWVAELRAYDARLGLYSPQADSTPDSMLII